MSSRKRYPTDLTDEQWSLIEPLLPQQKTGRPRKYSQREMFNAIAYLMRTGCSWRMLPHDLPPWQAVYAYFRKLTDAQVWERINNELREELRIQLGRDPQPSVVVIDAQSVKTTEKGASRIDGGKRVKGRKRQLVVDTEGFPIRVLVHPANEQDKFMVKWVLRLIPFTSRWQKVIVDAGYDSPVIAHLCQEMYGVEYEIVKRKGKGFKVLPSDGLLNAPLLSLENIAD